jgi:hypothetical protein
MRRWISVACLLLAGLAASACKGTDAINLNETAGDASGAAGTGASGAVDQQAAAAAIAAARVHFAAAIGTSAEALRPLEDGINRRARERKLQIENEGEATLVVSGYFSAVAEEQQTIVIYVWDVTDKAGNRLHRVQGQERISDRSGGWEVVDAQTMTTIGQKTVDELADWLTRGRV